MIELNKNILFQYFDGTASPLQRTMILEWLQDDKNQQLFYQWLEEWEHEHVQFIPNVELRLANVMERLDKFSEPSDHAEVPMISKNTSIYTRKIKLVAAAITLLVFVSLHFLWRNFSQIRYQTAFGEVKTFTLSDGSTVVLNANSSLTVPRWGFNERDRQVELTGEAAFYVKHTLTNQKFLVKTSGPLDVEVLGTEFSVYSRDNNNKVELKKGSVKVVFKETENKSFLMKPGDLVAVNNTGHLLVKHEQSLNNFIPWKDHHFVFDSASLSEVVHSVHEFFGDNIIIRDEELKQKRITGSFRAESSSELLSALALMFEMNILFSNDTLQLERKR